MTVDGTLPKNARPPKPQMAVMKNLLDHSILLVTGKGGVGKSTVAATLARRAARDGKKVLLIELESVSRAAPLFRVAAATPEAKLVDHNIWLMGVDALTSLHYFALQQLRLETVVKLALRNNAVRGFFMAMPGIKSILFLYHLWRLESEHGPAGDGSWDLIVCDLPTSGYVIGLYGVPTTLRQIFRVGPMAKYAAGMAAMLSDPRRAGLVLVTLPEEMPVVETVELIERLRTRNGVEAAAVFVNGIYPELVAPAEIESLVAASGRSSGGGSPELEGLLWAAELLAGRNARAKRLLPLLRSEVGDRMIELPHLFRRHMHLAGIDELAAIVGARLAEA